MRKAWQAGGILFDDMRKLPSLAAALIGAHEAIPDDRKPCFIYPAFKRAR